MPLSRTYPQTSAIDISEQFNCLAYPLLHWLQNRRPTAKIIMEEGVAVIRDGLQVLGHSYIHEPNGPSNLLSWHVDINFSVRDGIRDEAHRNDIHFTLAPIRTALQNCIRRIQRVEDFQQQIRSIVTEQMDAFCRTDYIEDYEYHSVDIRPLNLKIIVNLAVEGVSVPAESPRISDNLSGDTAAPATDEELLTTHIVMCPQTSNILGSSVVVNPFDIGWVFRSTGNPEDDVKIDCYLEAVTKFLVSSLRTPWFLRTPLADVDRDNIISAIRKSAEFNLNKLTRSSMFLIEQNSTDLKEVPLLTRFNLLRVDRLLEARLGRAETPIRIDIYAEGVDHPARMLRNEGIYYAADYSDPVARDVVDNYHRSNNIRISTTYVPRYDRSDDLLHSGGWSTVDLTSDINPMAPGFPSEPMLQAITPFRAFTGPESGV